MADKTYHAAVGFIQDNSVADFNPKEEGEEEEEEGATSNSNEEDNGGQNNNVNKEEQPQQERRRRRAPQAEEEKQEQPQQQIGEEVEEQDDDNDDEEEEEEYSSSSSPYTNSQILSFDWNNWACDGGESGGGTNNTTASGNNGNGGEQSAGGGSGGGEEDEDSDEGELYKWELLDPFQRLEKICNHSDPFRRLLASRTVPDALSAVADSSFDVARILLILNKIAEDPEVSVRLELLEYIPRICVTCHNSRNQKLEPLILSHILPLNLKFLLDRDVKVRKAAQKSLILLFESDSLHTDVMENMVCQHIVSLAEHEDEVYQTSAVELMSELARYLSHELTEKLFVPKFIALCSLPELNVRYVCASNFGDFCAGAVSSHPFVEQHLLPNFVRLTQDQMWNVRKACANVMMSVSCACHLETRKTVLAPIFARLLNDENRWVRATAFQTLGPFITTFAQPSITGLAYNVKGELVLINPEGDEFKCPLVSQTLTNIMYSMDSTNESLASLMSGVHRRENFRMSSFLAQQYIAANINLDNSNCMNNSGESNAQGTTTDDQQRVDENFNHFQYWREPIPNIEDDDVDVNTTTCSNVVRLSNSIDNLSLSNSDTNKSTTKDVLPSETSKTEEEQPDEDVVNHNDVSSAEDDAWLSDNCDFRQRISSPLSNIDRSFSGSSNVSPSFLQYANSYSHAQQIVPQKLIDYYVTMFRCGTDQNENTDLAHHCAFSLPAVALTLGSSNWCLLKSVYFRLASDEALKVRRTVASSIHELASIVGAEAATEDLLPVYSELIKDLDEVRIGALRILSRFLYLLKPEGRLKFLPMFNNFLLTDYEWNWRFRAEFAKQLSQCLCFFSPKDVWKHLAPLALLLLADKVAAVRRTSIELINETVNQLSQDPSLLRSLLSELAENFAHSSEWHQRQTFALLCAKLVQNSTCLSSETFACDLLPHLLDLAQDQVPNVRLCVARTLSEHVVPMPYFKSPCPHSDYLMATLYNLMQDKDRDVRYYAQLKATSERDYEFF